VLAKKRLQIVCDILQVIEPTVSPENLYVRVRHDYNNQFVSSLHVLLVLQCPFYLNPQKTPQKAAYVD
jgi:hypothetical protein